MQTIEYRTVDKSTWGRGPWQDEPDKVQWQDEKTGLACLIRRAPGVGSLCGYVGVPQGHPWHGMDYGDVDASVHGGLTFAQACGEGDEATSICHKPEPGEPQHLWWLGFDAAHSGDLCPTIKADMAQSVGMVSAMFGGPVLGRSYAGTYRDLEYVREEVTSLARQAAEVTR